MILFLNKYLVEKKKVYIALKKVYGIGFTYSKILCKRVGINEMALVKDVSSDLLKKLTKYVNGEALVNKELKNSINSDIKVQVKIKSYKGIRHLQGLPVNGQNTKNNSKTAKYLLRQVKDVN